MKGLQSMMTGSATGRGLAKIYPADKTGCNDRTIGVVSFNMKLFFALMFSVLVSCSGKVKLNSLGCQYTKAVITNHAPTCQGWGIVVGTHVYPSRNIPDSFKTDGMEVCVNYSLFDDMALCPCCGGVYANIISMSVLN